MSSWHLRRWNSRHRDRHQHCERRWEEAPGSPGPEGRQAESARRQALFDEQRGDEEAREDEEQVDAEVATAHGIPPEVVGHHRQHRQCSETVEWQKVPTPDGGTRRR